MSYQNGPDNNLRNQNQPRNEAGYIGWIIGGALALAVIIGIFVMFGRTNQTNTASNTPRPAATTVPAPTSGSGTTGNTQVAPDSGKATAGNPTTGSR